MWRRAGTPCLPDTEGPPQPGQDQDNQHACRDGEGLRRAHPSLNWCWQFMVVGEEESGLFYCCSFFQGCLCRYDNPCIYTGYLKNKTHKSRRGMGEEWGWMWQRLGSNYDNKNSLYMCMKFSRKKWSYLTNTSQCFRVDNSTYLEHPWLGGSFLVAPVCPLYLPMCLL